MKGPRPVPSPAVVFLLHLLLFLAVFPAIQDRVASGDADFAAFYGAAIVVREGNGGSLYDYQMQASVQHRFLTRPNPLAFYHLPFELLVLIPLSFLPYRAAYFAWVLLNLLVLSAAWRLLQPNLRRLPSRQQWMAVWAGVLPVMVTLIQGQDSILLLFLYVLGYRAFQSGRTFLTGCVLALGLFKFHLVVPFALLLILGKQGRAVLGFVLGAALVSLVSLGMVGSEGAASYTTLLLQASRGGLDPAGAQFWGVHSEMMPNARGFLLTVAASVPQELAFGGLALLSIVVLLAVAWVWRARDRRSTTETILQFSLALTATLIVSYHLHLHDLVLLFLPAVALLENALALPSPWSGLSAARAIEGGLILFTPICLILLTTRVVSPLACFTLAGGVILWFELRCMGEGNSGDPLPG